MDKKQKKEFKAERKQHKKKLKKYFKSHKGSSINLNQLNTILDD